MWLRACGHRVVGVLVGGVVADGVWSCVWLTGVVLPGECVCGVGDDPVSLWVGVFRFVMLLRGFRSSRSFQWPEDLSC